MQKSDPRISDFDHFLKELNTFLPPQFICALSYTALISQLNRTLIKLSFIVYREKISEIGLELWPFSEDFSLVALVAISVQELMVQAKK